MTVRLPYNLLSLILILVFLRANGKLLARTVSHDRRYRAALRVVQIASLLITTSSD
jgi:hypothetical protein